MVHDAENVLGRSWLLLGPFANDKDAGHEQAYPPEKNKIESIDLASQYDGLGGKVRWQLYHSPTDKVDLQKFFGHGEAGVAYAVCWVKHAWRGKAILATGSDDGIKVWIDRRLVLDKAVHREAVPGDEKTPVVLDAGWQEVLVKVDNRFGTWAFYFDLLDPATGKPLRDQRLRVRTTPPNDGKRFVKDWLVLGPFADPDQRGHGRSYPPEKGPVELQREYDGRGGKVRWREYHSVSSKIDLLGAFALRPETADRSIGYAVCWVRPDRKRHVLLATGSDDGIKVWLNRRIVHDKNVQRKAEPNSDRVSIELMDGWNEVLVKIDNRMAAWEFYLELRDPATDEPLPGLEYRTAPPEKKR